MGYEVGAKVRLPVEVRDPAGVLTNATMTVLVEREDGTPYTGLGSPVNDGTGLYHIDAVVDTPGLLRWTWNATGAVIGVYRGQAYVRTPFAGIISLKEAKEHLNKRMDDTTDDEELLDWIDAITLAIEKQVGPVVLREYIESYSGGSNRIFLRERPVISVTQVLEDWGPDDQRILTEELYGGPYADDQYTVDEAHGVITRHTGGYPMYFPAGTSNIEITYTAGKQPIPQNIRTAAKELLNHHWRASQIATGQLNPRVNVPQDTATTGIAIPNRVTLLLGYRRGPRLGG